MSEAGGTDLDDIPVVVQTDEQANADQVLPTRSGNNNNNNNGGKVPRKRSGLRKRDKFKLTFMWILLVVDVVLVVAVLGLFLTYEETQTDAALTIPQWIAWDISPGAFVGCRSLPPQLYGSFGPTQVYNWDPKTRSDAYHKQCPEGEPTNGICSTGTVAKNWTIDEVIGTPNGATILKWSPDGYNEGLSSVECATAWGA